MKLCSANEPVRTVVLRDCGVHCVEAGHCGLTVFPVVKSTTTH